MWRRLVRLLFPSAHLFIPPPPLLSETEFLARVRAGGLDWSRSVEALQAEHGSTQYLSSNAVLLPETTALTPFPIRFHVRVPGTHDHCPPQDYSADIDLHGDAEQNFRTVRDALNKLLGPGRSDSQSSNVVELIWHIGVFRVRLTAFPQRLNKRPVSPAACLSVTSRVPHAPPDESLRAVASLGGDSFLRVAAETGGMCRWTLARENFTTVLNPPGLFQVADGQQPLVWRDSQRGRIGVTGSETSFVFDQSRVIGLKDVQARPARGCGYREAEIALRRAGSGMLRVTLLWAPWRSDLSALVHKLAEFWRLPVEVNFEMDD